MVYVPLCQRFMSGANTLRRTRTPANPRFGSGQCDARALKSRDGGTVNRVDDLTWPYHALIRPIMMPTHR
jgi:hypothetical protein